MGKMRLFGEPGWGSAIVEAQLDWYGIEYDFERVGNLFKSAESRERVATANPLAQVPTLVLADGAVLTESAAITLYLAELTGKDSLVPRAADAARAPFLRWLVFLVANVYPTYTYGDEPSRFVDGDGSAEVVSQPRRRLRQEALRACSRMSPARRGSSASASRRSISMCA